MTTLINRLCFNSLLILFLTILIMAVKKLYCRHMSLRARYRLWLPLLFLLAVPFIPIPFGLSGHLAAFFNRLTAIGTDMMSQGDIHSEQTAVLSNMVLPPDFYVSAGSSLSSDIWLILAGIWIAGMTVMTLITLLSLIGIHRIRKEAQPCEDIQIRTIYFRCCKELNIKRKIPLLETQALASPAATGIFSPGILIPAHMISSLPDREIQYILMHELQHCRHRDTLMTPLACLAKIFYWFHPAVWLALNEMRNDCELACDGDVLSMLSPQDYTDYGITLLHFSAQISRSSYPALLSMGTAGRQLKKRILNIKGFKKISLWKRVKSAVALLAVSSITMTCAPLVSAGTYYGDTYHFYDSNMVSVDLGNYFGVYEGSFVLYDRNRDMFSIYREPAAVTRVSPDSTYKIYSALTALEHGVISPESNMLAWNQTPASIEAWNRDQTLTSALQNSVNWYFQELDAKTGLPVLKSTLDTISYGNRDCSGGLHHYWLESTLKISPVEQVELLTQLQEGTLPFDPVNQNAVKDALLISSGNSGSLYGKTGTGSVDGLDKNGWFIGFAETGDNVYVFAANIQGEDGANGRTAGEITLNILKDLDIPVS